MNVKGTVIQILNPETGVSKLGKDWSKQDFVIETNEQYPKKVCFTLFGDKTSLLNGISEGIEVDVHFNLESRDFNGKWYHNINAWKIENLGIVSGGQNNESSVNQTVLPPSEEAVPDDESNDLPF